MALARDVTRSSYVAFGTKKTKGGAGAGNILSRIVACTTPTGTGHGARLIILCVVSCVLCVVFLCFVDCCRVDAPMTAKLSPHAGVVQARVGHYC